jgi:XTP/dITP diphosphohydrolase
VAGQHRRYAARQRGFGYDSYFQDNATSLTGAELPLEQKNALSHRGQAMRALLAKLDALRTDE